MDPLDLVKLPALMELSRGRPEIAVGLIDGPVATLHPDLAQANIQVLPGKLAGVCVQAGDSACLHGTFVAGVLCASRSSIAPAICPNCTLLVRPVFAETSPANGRMPSATPGDLAEAIIETVGAGARVINLSLALAQSTSNGQHQLKEALDYCASRGVIVLAAAGNQGTLGSSVITRHPWVISVVAYDLQGRPMVESNLGSSIGRGGLGAPGEQITSLGALNKPLTFGGTSAATPFVTGAVALLWSEYPSATAAEVKLAILQGVSSRRSTVVPPLLDASAAYHRLRDPHRRN